MARSRWGRAGRVVVAVGASALVADLAGSVKTEVSGFAGAAALEGVVLVNHQRVEQLA